MDFEDMTLEELAKMQEMHRGQMEANRRQVKLRKERAHRLFVIGSALAKYKPTLTEMDDDDIKKAVAEIAKDI